MRDSKNRFLWLLPDNKRQAKELKRLSKYQLENGGCENEHLQGVAFPVSESQEKSKRANRGAGPASGPGYQAVL